MTEHGGYDDGADDAPEGPHLGGVGDGGGDGAELGQQTLVLAKSPDYEHDLKAANKKKNGRPFKYAESLIMSLAIVKSVCRVSFRALGGIAAASLGEDSAPGYRQLQRRIKSVDVSIVGNTVTARGNNRTLSLTMGGDEPEPNTRGKHIRYRHKTKRGSVRFALVVDEQTREILSFSVTSDTADGIAA